MSWKSYLLMWYEHSHYIIPYKSASVLLSSELQAYNTSYNTLFNFASDTNMINATIVHYELLSYTIIHFLLFMSICIKQLLFSL